MKFNNFDIYINIPIYCILDFSLTEEINHHTMLRLKGICEEDNSNELFKRGHEGINIEVKEEGKIIFAGILERIFLKSEGRVIEFEIFACSYSFILDIEKQKRSFQCMEDTYQMVAEKALSSYPQGSVYHTSAETRIPHMFLQYDETDWEFLQRLASIQGGYICVNSGIPYPALMVVERMESSLIVLEAESYEMQRENVLSVAKSGEGITYIVEFPERFSAGIAVKFLGKELIVGKAETIVRSAELCCRLYLLPFADMKPEKQQREALLGLKLKGIVKEVKRNQTKIQFHIDQESPENGFAFIPYAGGVNNETGYYMPQPGDMALVSFSGSEETAIVTEMIRNRKNPAILAENPSIKYFSNGQKKGMYLQPEKLMLCEGQSTAEISLMKDGQALISAPNSIKMESGSKLMIGGRTTGENHIKLSPENISIRGGSNVSFQVGTSSICMSQNGIIKCKAESGVTCAGKPGEIKSESEYEFSPEGTSAAQGAMLAVASAEFISQAVSGNNSYQDSTALLGEMFGVSIAPPLDHGQSSQNYNPIRDGLLGGDEELFHAISYGESLNGEE